MIEWIDHGLETVMDAEDNPHEAYVTELRCGNRSRFSFVDAKLARNNVAFRLAQDRLAEKSLKEELKIAVA